jgi:hypothetical protein
MIKILLTGLGVTFLLSANAQEVIGSSGQTGNVANHEVSWTIGEIVTETGSTPTNSVTQGFHQPGFTVSSINENSISWEMKVYPNPVARELFIVPGENASSAFRLKLLDFQGRVLHESEFDDSGASLMVDNLPNSSYLLLIEDVSNGEILKYNLIKSE